MADGTYLDDPDAEQFLRYVDPLHGASSTLDECQRMRIEGARLEPAQSVPEERKIRLQCVQKTAMARRFQTDDDYRVGWGLFQMVGQDGDLNKARSWIDGVLEKWHADTEAGYLELGNSDPFVDPDYKRGVDAADVSDRVHSNGEETWSLEQTAYLRGSLRRDERGRVVSGVPFSRVMGVLRAAERHHGWRHLEDFLHMEPGEGAQTEPKIASIVFPSGVHEADVSRSGVLMSQEGEVHLPSVTSGKCGETQPLLVPELVLPLLRGEEASIPEEQLFPSLEAAVVLDIDTRPLTASIHEMVRSSTLKVLAQKLGLEEGCYEDAPCTVTNDHLMELGPEYIDSLRADHLMTVDFDAPLIKRIDAVLSAEDCTVQAADLMAKLPLLFPNLPACLLGVVPEDDADARNALQAVQEWMGTRFRDGSRYDHELESDFELRVKLAENDKLADANEIARRKGKRAIEPTQTYRKRRVQCEKVR